MQHTSSVPTMDQWGPYGIHRHVLHRLPRLRSHIFGYPTTSLTRCQQHPRSNTRLGDKGQTIQMRIPPKRNGIRRIYHWTRRSQDRPSQDASHMGLDKPQNDKGNSLFPRILQLLLTIYRRFQQNSKTTICTKKGVHRQMGMGRKGTTSLQPIENKTHHDTDTCLLQPPCTNPDRNRRFKIHLFQDIVTTMPGRKMATSGILIQDNVRCRMQLRQTRQGPTGNSSGIARMETIYHGEPEASMSPHRLQELSNLHDNEGAKWTTSTMGGRTKSIQLQNWISSRKGRRKTRRPYEKSGRPTHRRRPETHTKFGDLTTKKWY